MRFAYAIAVLHVFVSARLAYAADDLKLKDADGAIVRPFSVEKRIVVALFLRTDCPISNRLAPAIRRITHDFGSKVQFYFVYPDPGLSGAQIQKHLAAYGMQGVALHDPLHAFVRRAGAHVTPETVVFVSGKVVYRGRINNRFVYFNKVRPKATRHDLREVLERAVSGKRLKFRATKAIGCYIAPVKAQ